MKTLTNNTIVFPRTALRLALGAALAVALTSVAFAGNATWQLNPTSGDWNTATNWTPETVPNGAGDTAAFQSSNITNVSISAATEVNAITFNPGASAFTITVKLSHHLTNTIILTVSGTGIINNSGTIQNFATAAAHSISPPGGRIIFTNSASAGTQCVFTNHGGALSDVGGGDTEFAGTSTAGDNTFINEPGTAAGASGGATGFFENASAENAVFTANGATTLNALGGAVVFVGTSTAANATLTANGGVGTQDASGFILFRNTSGAASATLIANGVTSGEGGIIEFGDGSRGDEARVVVFGSGASITRGRLDLAIRNFLNLTIGSLEGDGAVYLAGKNLIVGTNDLSTTFSGEISHTGSGLGGFTPGEDSLTKIGKGKLILTGANLYSGGTTIKLGNLLVNNTSGSGTGTGPVFVNGGRLGGNGTVAGAVTVGDGGGRGAFLAPGPNATVPGRLVVQSALTFNSDATYKVQLNSTTATADKVVASGVTINTGAQFTFEDLGAGTLPPGTVFTVINNASGSAIAGTFSNLPDGSSFTNNGNTYRASYEGGDGNDLTLTVQ